MRLLLLTYTPLLFIVTCQQTHEHSGMSLSYVSTWPLKFSHSPADEKPRITTHKSAEKQLEVA
jgi:hypothetical protein